MAQENLRDFVEKVVDYSLNIVSNQGIEARKFEEKVSKDCILEEIPKLDKDTLNSVYRVFHWGLMLNGNSPLEYVLPEKHEENSRVFLRNGYPDKKDVADEVIRNYGDVLEKRVRNYSN